MNFNKKSTNFNPLQAISINFNPLLSILTNFYPSCQKNFNLLQQQNTYFNLLKPTSTNFNQLHLFTNLYFLTKRTDPKMEGGIHFLGDPLLLLIIYLPSYQSHNPSKTKKWKVRRCFRGVLD